MMTIGNATLTKEQKACVDFHGRDCLVRGVAGSGKSYVVLRRAVKLNKDSKGKESVHIFMFNASLVQYTEELLRDSREGAGIEVTTVDRYCIVIYNELRERSHLYRFRFAEDDDRHRIINTALRTIDMQRPSRKKKHRFFSLPVSFWEEEFRWIKGRNILTLSEYTASSRKGRGGQVKMSEKDKELAWEIYSEYQKMMKRRRCNDWEDIYIFLLGNVEKIPEKYFIDHVLIDEAQDLTLAKMKTMRLLSRKSFTIAADIAQKIYKTTFSWREVGVELLGPASKKLSKSFRSTEQIVLLAEDLLEKNRIHGNKEEYTQPVIPELQGPEPLLVDCNGNDQEAVLTMVRLFIGRYPDDTVAVVYRSNKEVYRGFQMFNGNGIHGQVINRNIAKKGSILSPGLKLVTAHSSKGLEFDCVIICRLNEGNYPNYFEMRQAADKEEALNTERSLLYVAMTRARRVLMMSFDRLKRSSFIEEFNLTHYKMIHYPEDNILLESADNSET